MANVVGKVIELIGVSEEGIEDAIRGAVEEAAMSVRELQWFQVSEIRGAIKDGKVDRFQVIMRIGFGIEEKSN